MNCEFGGKYEPNMKVDNHSKLCTGLQDEGDHLGLSSRFLCTAVWSYGTPFTCSLQMGWLYEV